jgi:hypothetical protein
VNRLHKQEHGGGGGGWCFLLKLVHGDRLFAQGTQPEDMPGLGAVFIIEIIDDRRVYFSQP